MLLQQHFQQQQQQEQQRLLAEHAAATLQQQHLQVAENLDYKVHDRNHRGSNTPSQSAGLGIQHNSLQRGFELTGRPIKEENLTRPTTESSSVG